MRIRAIVNGGSGTVERENITPERVVAAFARQGVEAEVVFATGPELKPELARAAADAKGGRLDAVAAGGGDGTLGTAAGLLAWSQVPLGVLPVGTRNHFARDLGIPLDIEGAAAVVAARQVRAVDVAEVNGIIFVNNALIGVYPYMVFDRERRRKAYRLDKQLAMAMAFARMLWRFPKRRLTIRSDSGVHPHRTPCLFVGNNAYVDVLADRKRLRIDRGELWLLVVKEATAAGFMKFLGRTMLGGLHEASDFEVLRGQRFEIEARTSRMPVAHDGEVTRLRPPIRFRIHPLALQVLVPPSAEAEA